MGMGLLFPQLPFGFDDLEPAMSQDALSLHFTRHHLDHFERASALARRVGLDHLTLDELVVSASRASRLHTLYRHSAEAWNHACFWRSMRAGGGGAAYGAIGDCLRQRFGSHERFARRFHGVAATLFGNGWLWLTWKGDRIRLLTTGAGDSPLVRGHIVLLAVDLWEHAYYLDHQNRRKAYLDAVIDQRLNWEFAAANLTAKQ